MATSTDINSANIEKPGACRILRNTMATLWHETHSIGINLALLSKAWPMYAASRRGLSQARASWKSVSVVASQQHV